MCDKHIPLSILLSIDSDIVRHRVTRFSGKVRRECQESPALTPDSPYELWQNILM
jgi:hypothetical protein